MIGSTHSRKVHRWRDKKEHRNTLAKFKNHFMNSAFFADASLVLTTAARDFQRAIDQQITSFKKEMELHERAMDELNSRRLSQP